MPDHDVILAKLQNIEEKLEITTKVLLGNGDPAKSVVTRLTRLEDSVTACQTERSRERDKKDRMWMAWGACIFSATVSIIIAITK